METGAVLEYEPFNSTINPSFWTKYTEIKLTVDKLSEEGRPIWGSYSNLNIFPKPIIEFDSTSFNTEYGGQNTYLPIRGSLYNKNTLGSFKDCNKQEFIDQQGLQLWKKIEEGEAIQDPTLLNTFFILSFADLKKYNYYYWCAFPVLADVNVCVNKVQKLPDIFEEKSQTDLVEAYGSLDLKNKVFFCVKRSNLEEVHKIESLIKVGVEGNLKDFEDYYFVYADAGVSDTNPGWTLRNYISLLLYHCPRLHGKTVEFIALRLSRKGTTFCCSNSLILSLNLPDYGGDFKSSIVKAEGGCWFGWERNERGKLGPRLANVKSYVDPSTLAENAVDLNLTLIKWRILPVIDLDKIKSTKCLLLGAGTLGCNVARALLGWGVRNITLVDNSTVSMSNPVRQSLFTYEDSIQNKPKAKAAAEALKKIFPAVNARGIQIEIPMPGHVIGPSEVEATEKNVKTITDLISEHDVIFLLMDSRESRWLPSLLATYYKKLVINAALGFDTFLVMRHGIRIDSQESGDEGPSEVPAEKIPEGYKRISGKHLGCYFCNDITAPGNSMSDRTLDQQCTVTRPGMSFVTASFAVELAVSILQHESGALAPAYYTTKYQDITNVSLPDSSILGNVPHSIRGFLSSFSQLLPAVEYSKKCIACSEKILSEYKTRGFPFLLEVFNNSKYLEQILDLHYGDDTDDAIWELSDDEEA